MANLSIINIRSLTLFLNVLVETQSDDALSLSISLSLPIYRRNGKVC